MHAHGHEKVILHTLLLMLRRNNYVFRKLFSKLFLFQVSLVSLLDLVIVLIPCLMMRDLLVLLVPFDYVHVIYVCELLSHNMVQKKTGLVLGLKLQHFS